MLLRTLAALLEYCGQLDSHVRPRLAGGGALAVSKGDYKAVTKYSLTAGCFTCRLRTDMKSLTQGGASNLQDRVIQSGLDAITGVDAPRIVSLFKALAIYAEGECYVSDLISQCISSLCVC